MFLTSLTIFSLDFTIYDKVSSTIFFQAEDGIRDRSPSRGLGDVYKRQVTTTATVNFIKLKYIN